METKTNRQECQSKEQSKLTASCESPDNESRVSTSSESTKYEIDAKELKESVSFAKLLGRNGKKVIEAGGRLRCMCPFHKDDQYHFYIWSNDSGGRCYGCDWKGDIYAYLMKKHDVGFYDAVLTLNEQAHKILRDEEGVR